MGLSGRSASEVETKRELQHSAAALFQPLNPSLDGRLDRDHTPRTVGPFNYARKMSTYLFRLERNRDNARGV